MCSRLALAAFVFTLSACASSGNDFSTVHPPAVDATASASFATTPFYVDFRTRPDATNSHTFLEYGAQDSSGRPIERKTVGFYPRSGGAPSDLLLASSQLPARLARKITLPIFLLRPHFIGI